MKSAIEMAEKKVSPWEDLPTESSVDDEETTTSSESSPSKPGSKKPSDSGDSPAVKKRPIQNTSFEDTVCSETINRELREVRKKPSSASEDINFSEDRSIVCESICKLASLFCAVAINRHSIW